MIFRSMTELIGATPLVELCRYREQEQLGARILAKLESFNPAGSAKDRIALRMIEDAEQTGRQPGATIIEPTSGNTGRAGPPWRRHGGIRRFLSCRRR